MKLLALERPGTSRWSQRADTDRLLVAEAKQVWELYLAGAHEGVSA